jgi:transcriptional regulator with XRE-family HTH domain
MGKIFDEIQKRLSAHTETLREIERQTGINVATLSRIANGTRTSVSLDTIERLADYLGLELRLRKRR